MARITAEQAGGKNVVAFLGMIKASEIDAYTRSHSDDGYNVLVGSHGPMPRSGKSIPPDVRLFESYATHPNILNRELNSTAAGAYQLLFRYYMPYARLLGLHDFSPLSQDLIALQQIREQRALPLIQSGHIAAAIAACSNIWASLPGNSYGQHQNDIAMLTAAYKQAGGIVAIA